MIVAEPGLREADNDLNGFVLLSGGVCNVSSDTRAKLEAATIYGVAPTALYLLGLPKSEEMTGNVLLKAIAPSFRSLYKPRVVKSLGRKDTPSPVLDYEQQQERLDRLREMGYL